MLRDKKRGSPQNIPQKVSELVEKLTHGFMVGDREYRGLTIEARQTTLQLVGQIAAMAIIPLHRGFGAVRSSIASLLDRTSNERLLGVSFARHSAKWAAEQMERSEGYSQSPSQFRKMREYLAALGCFSVEKRSASRVRDLPSADEFAKAELTNFTGDRGKKHITELYNVNIERLALVAAALVQSIKAQPAEHDGWLAFGPSHGCAFLAKLWRKLFQGSLFAPDTIEADLSIPLSPEQKAVDIAQRIHSLENYIAETEHLIALNRDRGIAPSEWALTGLERDRTELVRLHDRASASSLR